MLLQNIFHPVVDILGLSQSHEWALFNHDFHANWVHQKWTKYQPMYNISLRIAEFFENKTKLKQIELD